MDKKSYEDLETFTLSKELVVKIHKMSLESLPKYEMYEEGSQIRRSSKSIVANIVEGYGRRRYKNDFLSLPSGSRILDYVSCILHPVSSNFQTF